jgi:CubicO group peptidase (beta-lactamase class C family)
MFYRVLFPMLSFLFVCFACHEKAYAAFNWFDSMSVKAERAKTLLDGFDEIIEQALKDFNVPGLSIGIVVDGHVILTKGYGIRDLERKLSVTSDTLFAIGSCTKAFSTFAIGMFVEQGLMGWDQPICDILPDFCLSSLYATQNVTIRDFLTHRSGMARHAYMWYNSNCSRAQLLQRLRYLEPACDVHERFIYGDIPYLIAGMAMEKIAKKPWEEVIVEKILKPLEMKRTNFSATDSKRDKNHAIPYVERNGTIRPMIFRDFSLIGPGGAMNSTAKDMTQWIKMLLAQGIYSDRTLLSTSILQEIFAGQVIVSGYAERKDLLLNAYGLGWYIHSYRGHYHVSHDGGVDGFTSVVGLLPYDGIGIVVLTNKNLSSLPRLIALEAMDRILELPSRNWLKEELELLQTSKQIGLENQEAEILHRKKGTTPSHSLEEYIGAYDHPGYGRVVIELMDGKLTAIYNDIKSTLDHWHYDVFSITKDSQDLLVSREGMKFTFLNNLNGDIEELHIPFEPKTADIMFKKIPDEQCPNLGYFYQSDCNYTWSTDL